MNVQKEQPSEVARATRVSSKHCVFLDAVLYFWMSKSRQVAYRPMVPKNLKKLDVHSKLLVAIREISNDEPVFRK
jgi:hypothetical protein